jgi:ketosteroid isomerase-like protein
MKQLYLLILLSACAVAAWAQTAPRPRTVAKPTVPESKQAATKPLPNTATAQVKEEILQLEHEWALALLQEDVKKLDKLLADNLQYTRSNGKVETKASYLAPLRNKTTTYSLVKRDDLKVQINGDTAIVTGRWKTTLQNKPNPPLTTTSRYLHVYMKQNGRWQLTTHQTTEIK